MIHEHKQLSVWAFQTIHREKTTHKMENINFYPQHSVLFGESFSIAREWNIIFQIESLIHCLFERRASFEPNSKQKQQ